jgi:hypothetical protein
MNKYLSLSRVLVPLAGIVCLVQSAAAQFYWGSGIGGGLDDASGVIGVNTTSPRQVIADIVNTALSYAALLAVVVIVIAGFFLIFSLGDDQNKDKAKKIILYTGIGLIVLLMSKVIVMFFILLPQ